MLLQFLISAFQLPEAELLAPDCLCPKKIKKVCGLDLLGYSGIVELMTTLIIPKELAKKGDLVLVPLVEYKEFFDWRKSAKQFKTFVPTAREKMELRRAREDYKKGKFISVNELKRKLEIKNKR